MLGDEGGLEGAVAVARDLDGELALVAADGLAAVAVASIGWAFRGNSGGRLMLFVAEVGGEFGVEDAVDKALFQLSEQAIGTGQVAGLLLVFKDLVEESVGDCRFHLMCCF